MTKEPFWSDMTHKAIGKSCQPPLLETVSDRNNSSGWAQDASADVPRVHAAWLVWACFCIDHGCVCVCMWRIRNRTWKELLGKWCGSVLVAISPWNSHLTSPKCYRFGKTGNNMRIYSYTNLMVRVQQF